ncbi:MAG: NADH-quinone oxidoreductase subunit J [Myxococcales bacterium]|nr:NADH-quinone oxidoreductase subunit J [Myxococcales bacterium]
MSYDFAIAAVVTLAGALLAISQANILHAVFGLAISLVGVAGIFFTLNSPFVAIMEVLIYVGGIAVTMIFAVMLSSVTNPQEKENVGRRLMAAVAAGTFFVGGALVLHHAEFADGKELLNSEHSLQAVGVNLLNRYNLAFETLSVVLLLAIVGAIVIVRKEPAMPADAEEEAA